MVPLGALLCGACDSTESDSTFHRLETQLFAQSCASASCHDAEEPAADLRLVPEQAYASLVNTPPTNQEAYARGWMRVMPHAPERSFLMAKLAAMLDPDLGSPMPKGAPGIGADAIEIVKAWIAAGAPEQGVVEGDDGRDIVLGGGGGEVRLEPPERGVQLSVTARAVPPGKEETLCHYFKLPTDLDLDVNRIEVAVSGGSHHIHLYRPYRSDYDRPDGFEECNMAVDFDVWELVVVTQLPYLDWQLPEGVGIRLKKGEQVLMQTHFVNVGQLETSGEGLVLMNLHAAEEGAVRTYAGSLFGQNRDIEVPPRSSVTASAKCVFPKDVRIIAQSGHYHFRGRRFSTYLWSNARGAELYHHEGYDEPLFLAHDEDAPEIRAGQGIEWECAWDNPSDVTYGFGPFTDTDEHCNLFGFYYPADSKDEAITCVKNEGKEETTVRRTDSTSE